MDNSGITFKSRHAEPISPIMSFKARLLENINGGVKSFGFYVKVKTREKYIYTYKSFTVNEDCRLSGDILLEECVRMVGMNLKELNQNLKDDGMLFLPEEMRLIEKDIHEVWVDVTQLPSNK